ncbi:MAG: NAD(P)H-hydrate dehydratase [Bdellovibrionaceae bacterium]|nr:NAD(P)H-hydrate dehydratase [Pseudobdellovibrionaceae bacterium]
MKRTRYLAVQAAKDLPSRRPSDNKTRGGKTLIRAGSKTMLGAAILSATAAARVGAGYVYLLPADKNFPHQKHPDFLTLGSRREIPDVSFSSIAIGPGLPSTPHLQKEILWLLKHTSCPVVVDAGALTALASFKKPVLLPDNWILTPHEGELGRLLSLSGKDVRKDRLGSALKAQKKWGGTLLLKGSGTLIVAEGKVIEITTGNAALAKAGTGDVLTGMIAGFLAQGLSPRQAACLGAFVHGAIADHWIKNKKDVLSLMASDILGEIPFALARLRRS